MVHPTARLALALALTIVLLPVAAADTVPAAPPCPTDVRATATPDGHATVTWTIPEGAAYTQIEVQRHFSLTGWRVVATLPGDAVSFEVDVDLDQPHFFRAVGFAGEVECVGPGSAELVVIPEFPGLALGVAAAGGLLGYAALRRR